jgi:hypothetical protein
MDISICIGRSNHRSRWIRVVITRARCVACITDPAIGTAITIWEGIIELLSKLLTRFA